MGGSPGSTDQGTVADIRELLTIVLSLRDRVYKLESETYVSRINRIESDIAEIKKACVPNASSTGLVTPSESAQSVTDDSDLSDDDMHILDFHDHPPLNKLLMKPTP